MGDFTWLSEIEDLSPPALTVRAQAVPPNDNGALLWDAFFPRQNVPSVKLSEMTVPNFRPAADRREWNQEGRVIPMLTPSMREMSMVPIEAVDRIDEEEMQALFERFSGLADVIRTSIGQSIPQRTLQMVLSLYRRIELDAFEAWANQRIVQKDPQNGTLTTMTFGFDAGRYQVAGTAWNDAGVNAYAEFLAWYREGDDELGGAAQGVMLRQATLSVIQEDAPSPVESGIELTLAQLTERIRQDLGKDFRFFLNERTVDQFNDGGTEYTKVKIWPANHIAIVPQGEAVGRTAFAPVVRAMQLSSQVPDADIDQFGVTVVHNAANAGKELIIQAQVNAFPIPNEQLMWVMDAGA